MPHRKQSLTPVVLACLALILATFVSFWGVTHNEFVNFDDPDYVTQNSAVQAGLNAKTVVWAFSTAHASNWHPLTWLSHMLDFQLFGSNPKGHHLTNLALHAATVVLLFLVLRATTDAFWRSLFVAAVFALHPLRVESVAWVSERKDVLGGLFWMLTIAAYARYVQKATRVRYCLALITFACGLMAKPMLVTLPFVLLLLDFWPLKRFEQRACGRTPTSQRNLLREKIPFFCMALIASAVTLWAQKTGGSVQSFAAFPLTLRIENAIVSYAVYIKDLFWPANLAVFYPYPKSIPIGNVALSLLMLIGVTAFCIKQLSRAPFLIVGWLWFLGTLVPVIGIIQVGNQARADRYTYLPLIGICIAVAWGLKEIFANWRWQRPLLGTAAVASVAASSVLTIKQVQVWKNSETVFRHALAVTSDNWTAHENLGIFLSLEAKRDQTNGRTSDADAKFAEAKDHLLTGLAIYPEVAESHHNLANVLFSQGETAEAEKHYLEATRLRPNYAESYLNLGTIAIQRKDLASARQHFGKAVELNPADNGARFNFATALFQLGEREAASEQYAKLLETNPNDVDALYYLGLIAGGQNKRDQAASYFRKVLNIQPNHPNAGARLRQLEAAPD